MEQRSSADPRLVEWAPGPPIEMAPEVLTMRAWIEEAGRRLLAIPDDRLEAVLDLSTSDAEIDVRYGFYRLVESLEYERGSILRTLIGAKTCPARGVRRGASSTAARWALHGLLLPLADEDLDRDPGGGEWSIRETLGHVISSQRSYGRYTAWWLTQAPTPAALIPDALVDELPTRSEEAAGSVSAVRARLDALLDAAMAYLGPVEDLSTPARWSGGEATVGFRIGRWASHIREHTIQVEKTFVMLGRQPTEVERLVALLFTTYGRVEELIFGMSPREIAKSSGGDPTVAATLSDAALELPAVVDEILAAAKANVRPPPGAG